MLTNVYGTTRRRLFIERNLQTRFTPGRLSLILSDCVYFFFGNGQHTEKTREMKKKDEMPRIFNEMIFCFGPGELFLLLVEVLF
jgi:hypothetical protein